MYGFTKKQLSQKVSVKCYRKVEKMTRAEALKTYYDGMICCDGSESERYANIFSQLLAGEKFVSDEL